MKFLDKNTLPDRLSPAVEADWSREAPLGFWDPGRKLLHSIRRYQHWRDRTNMLSKVARRYATLRYHFWSVVTGADIPLTCKIGGGLLIPHPNGIVIHPDVTIGINCLIFQQTTIGLRDPYVGVPEIGAHVDIGAGAKILGPVKIGRDAKIGANAVVIRDVAIGAVATGVH